MSMKFFGFKTIYQTIELVFGEHTQVVVYNEDKLIRKLTMVYLAA